MQIEAVIFWHCNYWQTQLMLMQLHQALQQAQQTQQTQQEQTITNIRYPKRTNKLQEILLNLNAKNSEKYIF